MATFFLDLPDEVLIRCLAGAGGMAIGCAAATCSKLHNLAARLGQLPVMSSAMSTQSSLQLAIKDAAERALSGCFGPVDFALLFVANYGNARGKKYNDPTDLGHAVEMLKEVLRQDIVIVGCACSGVMGVGPDSASMEVDPASQRPLGRKAAAAMKQAGLQAPPTKGVSILLGKLPPGCVARAFAENELEGPLPSPTESPLLWQWPAFSEAVALTSSQKTHLTDQLLASAVVQQCTTANSNNHRSYRTAQHMLDRLTTPEDALPADAAATAAASPATAAAAQQLLSVAAGGSASGAGLGHAAGSAAAGGASSSNGCEGGELELWPSLCLLLYDRSHQVFEDAPGSGIDNLLKFFAARGTKVVGGASSGAGDIFYSPGAAANRLLTDAPSRPDVVGLMLCTLRAPAAVRPAPAANASAVAEAAPSAAADAGPASAEDAAASAAGTDNEKTTVEPAAAAAGLSAGVIHNDAVLRTAAFSAYGLGPRHQTSLYYNVCAASTHVTSPSGVCRQVVITSCCRVAPAAAAAAGATGSSTRPDAADALPTEAPAGSQDGEVAGSSMPLRRSQRVAAATAVVTAEGGAVESAAGSSMQQLFEEAQAVSEYDEPTYVAFWRIPAGSMPQPFNGEGAEFVVAEMIPLLGTEASADADSRQIHALLYPKPDDSGELAAMLQGSQQPGTTLCMQLVGCTGHGCAATVRRGLSHMLPLIQQQQRPVARSSTAGPAGPAGPAAEAAAGAPAASAASGTSAAAVSLGDATTSGPQVTTSAAAGMEDCYRALACCAASEGARSGLQALAVFSCTSRGQSLYAAGADLKEDPSAYGQVCEAALIDEVCRGNVAFTGVYVDGECGPEVDNMLLGWHRGGLAAEDDTGAMTRQAESALQGYTSMYAAWGCG